jgi:ribonuclease HI
MHDIIKIYTDGSCLKNPNGPGGWAVCILENDKE